jgi:hypothetical protein
MGATYIALKRSSESIFLGTPKVNTHEFSHPLPFPAFLLPTNSKLTRIHSHYCIPFTLPILVNFCDETNLNSKGDKIQLFTHRYKSISLLQSTDLSIELQLLQGINFSITQMILYSFIFNVTLRYRHKKVKKKKKKKE